MNKKPLYVGLVISTLALVSYQTWKSMNAPIASQNEVSLNEEAKQEVKADNISVENKSSLSEHTVTKGYKIQEDDNTVTVKVALDGKIIKNIELSYYYDGPISKTKQDIFDKGLDRGAIIGKDITTLEVANVTGATWTSDTFKSAIKEIASKLGS